MLCVGVRYKMCPSNFSGITRITRILVIFLKKEMLEDERHVLMHSLNYCLNVPPLSTQSRNTD